MAQRQKSKKRASKETREADAFIQWSDRCIKWLGENRGLIYGLLVAFVIAGGGYAAFENYREGLEKKASDDYFAVEKQYEDLKEKYEKAEVEKEDKELVKKSGDLEKDFGNIVRGLKKVTKDHEGTQASLIAAMNLGRLFLEYEKFDEAQKFMVETSTQASSEGLVSGGFFLLKGTVEEAAGQCQQAIASWQKTIGNKTVAFFHPEAMLRQAGCHQTLKENDKAKELYKKISKNHAQSEAGKKAKAYLRLLTLNSQ